MKTPIRYLLTNLFVPVIFLATAHAASFELVIMNYTFDRGQVEIFITDEKQNVVFYLRESFNPYDQIHISDHFFWGNEDPYSEPSSYPGAYNFLLPGGASAPWKVYFNHTTRYGPCSFG